MYQRPLPCAVRPRCVLWIALIVVLFLGNDTAGLTTLPWVNGVSKSSCLGKGSRCVMVASGRGEGEGASVSPCSRRNMLRSVGLVGSSLVVGMLVKQAGADELPTVGKITKNGVKYFEYRVGEGQSPKWGQACIVRFVMYGRSSPEEKLIKIQSSDDNDKEPYLFKHGNGFQIKGMEEGVHSMKVGGRRRIILPQSLGYTVQGLGPYPAKPRKRDILVKVLTAFDKTTKGELVMDVELLEVFDDEADQGYYQDENLTPEELEQLVRQTGQFSTGSFEKLPGQMAAPMNNGVPTPPSKTDGLPGELGLELS